MCLRCPNRWSLGLAMFMHIELMPEQTLVGLAASATHAVGAPGDVRRSALSAVGWLLQKSAPTDLVIGL